MRLLTALVVAVALAGCSGSEPEPPPETTTQEPTPEPEPTPEGCTPAPFTGLADDGAQPAPVIGVKVENSAGARPQTGLEDADVVFVQMVEGGMTRFVALFNSQFPEVVGNIRSLRSTDAGILGQWSGGVTLVYSGGMAQQVEDVRAAGVELMSDGSHDGFFRSSERRRPHDLYLRLAESVTDLEAPAECPVGLFEYLDEGSGGPEGGAEVSEVTVAYPTVRSGWIWNGDAGAWERSDDGRPSVSESSSDVLTAVNVVVLRVQARDMGLTDSAGSPIPETVLVGEGDLSYFVDGKQISGTWSKDAITEPFEFFDAGGDPLLLVPGNTWVELLPGTGSLSTQ